ncbi:MAG: saccharopine dehydrogenase NADP-binding domain-containing protein [Gammaproteobacteria bacterium]|nr:saccharopine dehydrogenase NADP-binding domain-containing protein [Gammaproteobacteria bacterium]
MSREFEVIVWGATGFTGRLVAEYFLRQYGVGRELNWAIGGRNEAKLGKVRAELGAGSESLAVIVGDSDDEKFLEVLAARTRVVCTTVGPYALYGSKLVAACAEQGTHYCDLTGEVQWMRRMIDAHHDTALSSGARIVHTCGFDSIPSDIGVHLMQREMRVRHGVACAAVKYRTREFKGGFSGGTVASMLNMMAEVERDPSIREVLEDPYGLNPSGERRGLDGPENNLAQYDDEFGAWAAPFMMAAINTKVVRRSNALLDHAYGTEFRYDEATLMAEPLGRAKAIAMSGGTALFNTVMGLGGLRRMIAKRLPGPGQGPDKAARESGFFHIELLGKHPTDASLDVRGRINGDRDPGYGATAKMLGESAVCLAKDELRSAGGILTPAVAMGDAILARLNANAGVKFTVEN